MRNRQKRFHIAFKALVKALISKAPDISLRGLKWLVDATTDSASYRPRSGE